LSARLASSGVMEAQIAPEAFLTAILDENPSATPLAGLLSRVKT